MFLYYGVLPLVYYSLQIEARSVEHMKNVARGLENKVIELQQKLTEKVRRDVVNFFTKIMRTMTLPFPVLP